MHSLPELGYSTTDAWETRARENGGSIKGPVRFGVFWPRAVGERAEYPTASNDLPTYLPELDCRARNRIVYRLSAYLSSGAREAG